jgi:hypothetical protein
MKRIISKILVVVFSLGTNIVFAQYREPRGRYYPDDDIGLPPLGFTGKALIVAIILFALGWIISKANEKPNGEGGSILGGCLITLGFVCAIPVLAWLHTIVASIWIIGIVAMLIIGVIILLWDKIKGK